VSLRAATIGTALSCGAGSAGREQSDGEQNRDIYGHHREVKPVFLVTVIWATT
jgi:hypothetical protein